MFSSVGMSHETLGLETSGSQDRDETKTFMSRDRDETETVMSQDRDETETLKKTSRDRLETETFETETTSLLMSTERVNSKPNFFWAKTYSVTESRSPFSYKEEL
jgi:hypothetical protein